MENNIKKVNPVLCADPYVLFDEKSQNYYGYCTSGDDDDDFTFSIYRSKDLINWIYVGRALDKTKKSWAKDWFWAPECYQSPYSKKFFLFYSARVKDSLLKEYFGTTNYDEGTKIGVAVSSSPEGPFINLTDHPIEYYPYNPDQLVLAPLMKNPLEPCTLEEASKAKKGLHLSSIDVNVFFDDDGKIYLYFSKCAYPNWTYDEKYHKFIEESNICAVELNTDWYTDKEGNKPVTIAREFIDSNRNNDSPVREDGFIQVISYHKDPQAWENADIDDFSRYHDRKDRRWSEGSTTFTRVIDGKKKYFLMYSANHYMQPQYGVGVATSNSPFGPFKKNPNNPIISEDPKEDVFSTGHGSLIEKGHDYYYVFHARRDMNPRRSIYITKLSFDGLNISHGELIECNLLTD